MTPPPASRVAAAPDVLAERYRAYPYDVGPVTDDSPFFWHFARFRDIFGTDPKVHGAAGWRMKEIALC